MTNHTAQTLAKYYDQDVYFDGVSSDVKNVPEGTYHLYKVSHLIGLDDKYNSFQTIAGSVYPILKTVEDLTDEDHIYLIEKKHDWFDNEFDPYKD